MNRPLTSRLFVLVISLTVAGCYKEYSENFIEEETITQNAAIGQQLADDVLDMVYQAEVLLTAGTSNFPIGTSVCGTVSNDAVNKILTIDFGEECTNNFGTTQSGKLMVAYKSNLGDTLAGRLVTFDQYVVNLKKVEGTVALEKFQILPNGAYVAFRTLTEFKVTFPDGTGVTFNGGHDRVWNSGRGDGLATNNRYAYRGSMSGSSSSGRNFIQDIDSGHPVITDFYCQSQKFFARTYGVVELTKLDGYPDRQRTVNYGGDSTRYDNTVTVSTFRRTYGFTPAK